MTVFFILFAGCLFAFVIGSIPSGWIVGKMRGVDIRKHGSGNVGATNVLRVLGTQWGIVVFMCDTLKGYVVTTLLFDALSAVLSPHIPEIGMERMWSHEFLHVAVGTSVIAGHVWSVFLNFDGGKGVATTAGAVLGIDPLVTAIGVAAFIITVILSHYISLGSLLSMPASAIASLFLARPASSVIFITCITIVVWIRHRENISRLRDGTEKKIQFSRRGVTKQ